MNGNPIPDRSSAAVKMLSDLVHENMEREDFDVEEFAALAGVSRSELYRRIKKLTGKSVTHFIRDIRLEESLKLLQHTDWTASEVGYKVGFNSPTYFSKCFKDKFGITPGEADSGLTPIRGSLYDDHLKYTKPKSSGFWTTRRLWLLFILVFISGFGSWYYMASNHKAGKEAIPGNSLMKESEEISIAVLPIDNWTFDESKNYMCYGITSEIIEELNRTKSFSRITPINDVLAFKDSIKDMASISELLNVTHVINGNLQKAGSQIKISVQFYNIEDNDLLWQESFIIDWSPEEIFRTQQKIADEVLRVLGDRITQNNDPRESKQLGTSSTRAYDLYMQAGFQASKFTETGYKNALMLLEKAVEEDPEFIDAYNGLAATWLLSGTIWSYASQDTAWHQAKEYLGKILDIDPKNQRAIRLLKMGSFYYGLEAFPKSKDYPQINTYNLEDTHFDYALKLGLYGKSEYALKNDLILSPSSPNTHALLALTYYLSGKEQQALEHLDNTYPLYNDDHEYLRESAKTYYFLNQYDKMAKAIGDYYKKFEDRPPIILWLKAMELHHTNEVEERDILLDSLLARYDRGAPGSPGWFIALFHAHMEDYDKALDWLERSYAAREVEMTWLAQEPDLAPLGDEPRYQALLDSMNFPESARKHVKNSFLD